MSPYTVRTWLLALPLALAVACTGSEPDDDTGEPVDTGEEPVDADGDGFAEDEDCDDNDETIYPGAPEEDCTDPVDRNCDGEVAYADADNDGWAACEDCNDNAIGINPDADEICNGLDDDCDERIDDADDDVTGRDTWFADTDRDGFGDPASTTEACEQPTDFVADDTDCDDTLAAVNPGEDEICDELDNDCDELVDDADDDVVGQLPWFADTDDDGLGDPDDSVLACFAPEDYVDNERDCDDTDPEAGEADTWFQDRDRDLYGNLSVSTVSCVAPSGYVLDNTDCDDRNDAIYPGADEVCDEEDNDCDGDVDDDDADVLDQTDWYEDADGDEFGDEKGSPLTQCFAPSGYVEDNTDCDDSDDLIHPDAFDWDDDKSNDCDSDIDEDVGSETYTHDSDIQGIWNSNCTSCHGSSGGLSLRSSAHGSIVNTESSVSGMDYIEPGDPDDSYLWHKINGTHRSVGGSGSTMGSLSSSTLDEIETWILEGAVK